MFVAERFESDGCSCCLNPLCLREGALFAISCLLECVFMKHLVETLGAAKFELELSQAC